MNRPRHTGASSKGAIMKGTPLRVSTMALTFALLAAPATGFAQTHTPTREGNIWGWRDHQPTMTQTRQSEEAAGVAPKPSENDASSATVDKLYRELLLRSPD
jgi:hypothetical protein